MARLTHRALAAALLIACACAHQPPAPPAKSADAVWPMPPAKPELRLARVWTSSLAPKKRSLPRRVFDAIVGLDPANEPAREAPRHPVSVALLASGELYVADPDAPGVFRVELDGDFSPVRCTGRTWVSPTALAFAFGGMLVVADAGAGAVILVGDRGSCTSIGAGMLERPTGIASAGDLLYVVDPPRHAVVAFSRDGSIRYRFGERGTGDGQLSFPTAIATANGGELLVADTLNFRVGRFSSDGHWLGAFGSPGDAGGSFARPKGVAVANDGRIFVTDAQRDTVIVFAPDGAFLFSIGTTGDGPGYFRSPAGVAIAGSRLAVADSLNGRVQIFEFLGGST